MGGSLFLIKRRCNVYLVPNETAKILSTNQKFTIKFFISTILRKYTFSLFFVSNLFKYNRSNIIHCTYFIILILNLVNRKIKRTADGNNNLYNIYLSHSTKLLITKDIPQREIPIKFPIKKTSKIPQTLKPFKFPAYFEAHRAYFSFPPNTPIANYHPLVTNMSYRSRSTSEITFNSSIPYNK